MGKSITTLVDDIYALFGSEKENLDASISASFSSGLSGLIHHRLSPSEGAAHGPYLRMSNIGRPDRQVFLDINYKGERESLSGATNVKFMFGDIIEHMMLALAKASGHEVTHEQAEVEIDGIKGHLDCVIDGVVVDVKSASSRAFDKFANGSLLQEGMDPFGYVAQLAGYVESVTPGRDGAFLAVDKQLGKIALLIVPAEHLAQYDVRGRIKHIKEVVKNDKLLPKHCYDPIPEGKSGNEKLAVGCTYCGYKDFCWPDARKFLYSSGPVWLTQVTRVPNVPEVKAGGIF